MRRNNPTPRRLAIYFSTTYNTFPANRTIAPAGEEARNRQPIGVLVERAIALVVKMRAPRSNWSSGIPQPFSERGLD